MKFCKDCQHYRKIGESWTISDHRCHAREIADPVTGSLHSENAYEMRLPEKPCGPAALLFEPKPRAPYKDYTFFKYEYQFFMGSGVGMVVGYVVLLLVKWFGQ